ncbi:MULTISPECIES: stage II sporulation protein M [unclassified Novosphingobium]|uniref:stage II sporulation protein M n=1 Tax=unclassified Novosphingobium TaxID=2644732 RepID=UPI001444AB8C|nr:MULTISPECIES: stage II sporulation protein M [unclassified Novosphingobium]NKJ42869.1 putative membrane protein SpoIIM required for sporulation [Novosphingobium sp. SG720]NMN05495.1 putative membrane protein SpoIIM required for sporulation [Novosphingobium sp. SG919]NMN88146.1 putative membrane protein SpoIIM required for sporulation [Novosphingobium sp. SG916]
MIARWFGKNASQDAAVEAAALRSDRFRQAREGDWQRLETIVTRIEGGRLRKLSDEDLLALPALYRTAISSLAIARETSLDAALIAYLEGLARRAWFAVYGPREGLGAWLKRFFLGGWSAAVRGLGVDLLIALAMMVLGTVVGWLLVSGNPDWYYSLMGSDDVRVPGASREALLHTLFGQQDQTGLSMFAAFLFSNNAQVSLFAFALGFAFGLPSILLLIHNTAGLGALLWLYHGQGLTLELVGWLSIHGTTELFAILLAGGAGIHIGRAMAFPGDAPVLVAAAAAGRRAAQVMVGVVLMLICAAVLEGFGRQLVDSTTVRLAIGGTMLALWLAYFFAWRPARGQAAA